MTKRTYTRRSPSQWQHHLTDQQQSGLSIADYCKQHKIAASNFYTWRSKLNTTKEEMPNTAAEAGTDWFPITDALSTASSVNAQGVSMTLSLPGGMTLTLRSA